LRSPATSWKGIAALVLLGVLIGVLMKVLR
jgi:hypothetical protein